jgi:HTH-type transcriptional regulator/antitoxin HipB
VDYPIKTLSQLKPILQGFRKAAGLTQAAMASHLGVTQQTYAQLEANAATVSVERLFKVLRVLQVDLKLTQTADGSSASSVPRRHATGGHRGGRPSREKRVGGSGRQRKAQNTIVAQAGSFLRNAGARRTPCETSRRQNHAQSPRRHRA